jgi:hypothetical protein
LDGRSRGCKIFFRSNQGFFSKDRDVNKGARRSKSFGGRLTAEPIFSHFFLKLGQKDGNLWLKADSKSPGLI